MKKGIDKGPGLMVGIAISILLFVIYTFAIKVPVNSLFNFDNSQDFKLNAARCAGLSTGEDDSDGDGLDDFCDPCVDVHNGTDLSKNEIYNNYESAIEQNINKDGWKWLGKYKIQYELGEKYDTKKSPDNDDDGIPDACEMTKEQAWADNHPNLARILSTTNKEIDPDTLKKIVNPIDTADRAECRFWYPGGGCCSRVGDKIQALNENGEPKGKELKKACLPHHEKPER